MNIMAKAVLLPIRILEKSEIKKIKIKKYLIRFSNVDENVKNINEINEIFKEINENKFVEFKIDSESE